MTLVLSDGLFANQTEDGIHRVVNAKWNSLRTLNTIIPIQTLDFCISFSSVSALVGNLGQSNYAMANTIVDGYLARLPNAFSVSVPSISDLGYFARYQGARESNVKSTMLSPDGGFLFLPQLETRAQNIPRPMRLPRGRVAQAIFWRSRAILHP